MSVFLNYCALTVCSILATLSFGEPIELHFPNGASWSGDSEEIVKIVTTDGIKIGTIDKITPYNFTVTTQSGRSYILDLQIIQSFETFSNIVNTPKTPKHRQPTVSSITGPVDEALASLVSQIEVSATFQNDDTSWEITAVMAEGKKLWIRTPQEAHQKRIRSLDKVGVKWIVPRGGVRVSITIGKNNPIPLVAFLLSETVEDQFANSGMPKPIHLELKNVRKIVVPSTLEGSLYLSKSQNLHPHIFITHNDDETHTSNASFLLQPSPVPSSARGFDNRGSNRSRSGSVTDGWRVKGINRNNLNNSWNLVIPKIIEKLMKSLRVVLILNETDVVLAKLVSRDEKLQLSAESSEKLIDSSVVGQIFRDTAVTWVHLIAKYQNDLQIEKSMAKSAVVSKDWGTHKLKSKHSITVQLPCAHCSGRSYKPARYSGTYTCRGCSGSGPHTYTSEEVRHYWARWDSAAASAGWFGGTREFNISVPCYNHFPKTRTDVKRIWWMGASLAVGKIDSTIGQCVQIYLPNDSRCAVLNRTMDDDNQLAVSFSTMGSEQLTTKEASGSPSTPVDSLVDDNRRRVESPRNIFNGARFVFINDTEEIRVFKYNSRTSQLENVELLFEEWQQVRESLKQ